MRALLAALAVASVAVSPLSSSAKEHTAACSALPSIIDRLRGALVLAAIHRGRGSSLAAYETLRTSAANIAQDKETGGCGVIAPVLARSLSRASDESTALAASLQIDQGIAAALSVALTGSTTGQDVTASMTGKLLQIPESVEYGAGCPDLFQLVRRLTEPGAAGAPPPEQQLAGRVGALVSQLQAQGRCLAVTKLLSTAAKSALPHAIDSLRLDEPDQTRAADAGETPIARCPELPLLLDRIAATIRVGAPLYNKGDHAGCRDLYRRVARSLRDEVIPPGRCPAARAELDAALTAAAQASDPTEAAWALRHGFDHISERWQEPPP